jgi:hypothetical protein
MASTTGGGTMRACVGVGQTCSGMGLGGMCTGGECSNSAGKPCGGINGLCCGGVIADSDGGSGSSNQFCTASGTACDVGFCRICGGEKQNCCQGNGTNQCKAGLFCIGTLTADGGAGNDQCLPCGAKGQRCCDNDPACNTGLGCADPPGDNNSMCSDTCGASGAACCEGGNCQTGLVCGGQADGGGGGTCGPCGGDGQPCCDTGNECTTGLSCVIAGAGNKCSACGGSGQACCGANNSGSCTAGLGCAGRDANAGTPGMCGACGAQGQPCCSTGGADAGTVTQCMTDLSCLLSATGRQCGACGGTGQPCCGTGNNGTCSAGFACGGRDSSMNLPGMCAACGDTGQLCCPNGGGADGGSMPCLTGFSCLLTATTNQCGACGASGQPCCGTGNNGSCTAGFMCTGRMASTRMPGTCAAAPTDGGVVDTAPADVATGQ